MVYKYLIRLDSQQLTTEQYKKLIKDLHVLKDIELTQQLEPMK